MQCIGYCERWYCLQKSDTYWSKYRSNRLGPKYAHKTRLRVKHARVCVFDMRMRYAQKANSLVFMSQPIVVILLLVLMTVCFIHVKALALQVNMILTWLPQTLWHSHICQKVLQNRRFQFGGYLLNQKRRCSLIQAELHCAASLRLQEPRT